MNYRISNSSDTISLSRKLKEETQHHSASNLLKPENIKSSDSQNSSTIIKGSLTSTEPNLEIITSNDAVSLSQNDRHSSSRSSSSRSSNSKLLNNSETSKTDSQKSSTRLSIRKKPGI